MNYTNTLKGIFVKRPNRFLAHVLIGKNFEESVICHVKNTGRCQELLIPGCQVILMFHPDAHLSGRKTSYSLISVYKEINGTNTLINMDSQAPNEAVYEWLNLPSFHCSSLYQNNYSLINLKREVPFGSSRFDLSFDLYPAQHSSAPKKALMEVKGVTLEHNNTALFPDAPTQRGIKHIFELCQAVQEGYHAYLLFVIQMKGVTSFQPNKATHPDFAEAVHEAVNQGVTILAFDCIITETSMNIHMPVPVVL